MSLGLRTLAAVAEQGQVAQGLVRAVRRGRGALVEVDQVGPPARQLARQLLQGLAAQDEQLRRRHSMVASPQASPPRSVPPPVRAGALRGAPCQCPSPRSRKLLDRILLDVC